MRIGLATLHHGRRRHLERQAAAVGALRGLDRYVAVAMDGTPAPSGAEGLSLPTEDAGRLPLAAARNLAVHTLADCDLVILLDADCVPDPGLVQGFRAAAREVALERALLLGGVGWLECPVPETGLNPAAAEVARRREKRDFPERGLRREERPELFWSLCAAVSPRAHAAVGGFDPGYRGWGAEDTDYGRRAASAGLTLWKVAGAWAYHQPHPRARATEAHTAGIVANAARFHRRWGDWPMPDVLAELLAGGRISWDPAGGTIAVATEATGAVAVAAGPPIHPGS